MAVQFCGTCGHPLIPEQLFCQHCGSRADDNATRGAASATPGIPVSSAGTLYCGQCGALVGSQERVCRRCGAPVEPVQGGVSDPSLSDLPTQMGTPPPAANQPPPAYQPPTNAISAPPSGPRYADQPATNWGNQPPPGWANQSPPGWGNSYSPPPAYDESPTFTVGGAPRPAVQTPPPPYRPIPGGPGGPAPRRGQRWPVIVAIVLVALALIAGGGIFLLLHNSTGTPQTNGNTPGVTQTAGSTATVAPSPTQVVLNETTAKAVVQQFYDDINAKEYDAAYDLLSAEWQQTQTRQDFVTGYQTTVSDVLTILGTSKNSNGTIRVNVTLQATDNKNGSNVVTNYAGYYDVILEGGKILLLKGKIDKQ